MKRQIPDSLWGLAVAIFTLGVLTGCAIHAAVPHIPFPRILPEDAELFPEPATVQSKER